MGISQREIQKEAAGGGKFDIWVFPYRDIQRNTAGGEGFCDDSDIPLRARECDLQLGVLRTYENLAPGNGQMFLFVRGVLIIAGCL